MVHHFDTQYCEARRRIGEVEDEVEMIKQKIAECVSRMAQFEKEIAALERDLAIFNVGQNAIAGDVTADSDDWYLGEKKAVGLARYENRCVHDS